MPRLPANWSGCTIGVITIKFLPWNHATPAACQPRRCRLWSRAVVLCQEGSEFVLARAAPCQPQLDVPNPPADAGTDLHGWRQSAGGPVTVQAGDAALEQGREASNVR